MLRSTPNEFSVLGLGKWDYTTNTDVINNYWLDGAKRARNFESIYTMGMRGFGDCQYIRIIVNYMTDHTTVPLSEETNIKLLEGVIANQTNILKTAYGSDVDIAQIPQVWCLCTSILVVKCEFTQHSFRQRSRGLLYQWYARARLHYTSLGR